MSDKFVKPPVYNPARAEERIRELEAEIERVTEYNRQLIKENANLQIRCRILEADQEEIND